MQFKECTEDRYTEMLEILWPASWLGHGFLVGEALSHRNGFPVYAPFVKHNGKFYEEVYENYNGMSVAEFKVFDPSQHTFSP